MFKRFDTIISASFKDYILLTQWYPTTLTLTLASAGSASSYTSHGSNYGVTNVTITNDAGIIADQNRDTESLSWEISGASGGDITLSRQPKSTDFSNNIASDAGSANNTQVLVKALANADRGKVAISDSDADLITSGMVVKEYTKGEDLVKRIEEEEDVVEELPPGAVILDTGEIYELVEGEEEEDVEEEEGDIISEETELEAGATTVKEVTVSAIDTTNNFVTLSTSQRVMY